MRRAYNLCAEGRRIVDWPRVWKYFDHFKTDEAAKNALETALKNALSEVLVFVGDESSPPFGGERQRRDAL